MMLHILQLIAYPPREYVVCDARLRHGIKQLCKTLYTDTNRFLTFSIFLIDASAILWMVAFSFSKFKGSYSLLKQFNRLGSVGVHTTWCWCLHFLLHLCFWRRCSWERKALNCMQRISFVLVLHSYEGWVLAV